MQNASFVFSGPEKLVLSNAQYLDFLPNTRVSVSLDLTAYSDVDLTLRMMEWYEWMDLPPVTIPRLHSGERLKVTFSFSNQEYSNRIWVYLAAKEAGLDGGPLKPVIHVTNLSVSTVENPEQEAFLIDNFQILPAEELPPIAHAGGRYLGYTYTNSIEALEANRDKFNLFEIDFSWTSDNRLVGLHDWGTVFERLYGEASPAPLSLRKFKDLILKSP